jgi:NADH dehydrogenase FAD-containing subunit
MARVNRGRRLVLLGAGHAHLYTIKRAAGLARRGHELVIIAPEDFWYSGLATGMLSGHYPAELDRIDIAELAGPSARIVREPALAVEPASRTVRLAGGRRLPFDVLSLNLGSEPPPIEGAGSDVYSVKPIRRIVELRRDLEQGTGSGGPALRVVVAGGGATGCELAANLAGLARRLGAPLAITLIAGRDPLRQLPAAARETALRELERRGVTIRHVRISRLEPGRMLFDDGGSEPFDRLVNATGLDPNPLIGSTGLTVDDEGGLIVDPHLRSVADERIFGAGDCIALEGHPLPRIGVHAIRAAPILFANLLATLEGRPVRRQFRPQRNYLWIMNMGDGTGLAARGRFWWHGRSAFLLKDRIDRRFLRSYRTR